MLFHPEKKAEKWISASELIYLLYYESDDDDCGPSLMESVKLLRREGLQTFWFSAKVEGEIEKLLRVPEVDVVFLYGPDCSVHLAGNLDHLEHFENAGSCHVRFIARACDLGTSLRRKKIPIS